MTPPKAKVIRNNISSDINAEELVPGDIVILEAGNYVPADCRLIESYNLKVEESSLTGETEPVLKDADMICKKNISLGDQLNMVFMASIVVNGHAKAVVTDVGMNTNVGKIANMIIQDITVKTDSLKKILSEYSSPGKTIINLSNRIFLSNEKSCEMLKKYIKK